MPELPEVETVRRGLEPMLAGRRIRDVELRRPDLRFPLPPGFAERLRGRRVETVGRRAKYVLIGLDDGATWMVHLGMSGRFTFAPGGHASSGQAGHNSGWALVGRHDHVLVTMEDGLRVTYNDPRRFGFMDLIAADALGTHPRLAELGPEPLSDAFDGAYLSAALSGRRTSIKAALLDQHLVAGIGNIYACEALFEAGISPRRQAATVAGRRADRLAGRIKDVLTRAIAAGGSSLRDYRQADGELGYFQRAWRVYGREGEACPEPDCGTPIQRIVQAGRSTFYCARHQR